MVAPITLPSAVRELLLVCAVPNWIDLPLFQALHHEPATHSSWEEILAHLQPIQAVDGQDAYGLTEKLRNELLTELRDSRLLDYKTVHQRAFAYFCRQNKAMTPEKRLLYEDALVYHLHELFLLLMAGNELPQLEQILAEVTAVGLSNRAHQNSCLYYQGCLYNEQHHYQLAAAAFTELLQRPDVTDRLRVRTWTALGFNYEYQGLFDKAIAAHVQSRAIYTLLGDIEGISKTLNNEAIIHHQLAEYQKALPLLQESYRLAVQTGDKIMQGRALLTLGATAKDLGQWEAALSYLQQCLTLWQTLGITEFQARVHNNLGEVYHLVSRWDEAAFHYEQAIAIALNPNHENKREAIDMLLNLGFLRQMQGNMDEAERLYEQAYHLADAIDHLPAQSQIKYRLGMLTGDAAKAKAGYQQAITIIEEMRSQIQEETTRIGLFGTRQYVYQAMVLNCLARQEPKEAFATVERARSRAFLDMLQVSQMVEQVIAETTVTIEQLQAQLTDDTVVIEFYATGATGATMTLLDRLPPESQSLRRYLAPPAHLFAFVISHDDLQVYELSVDLRRLAAQFFQPEDGRLLGVTPLSGQPLHPLRRWRALHQQLLAPLQPQLVGKRHLYLIPHDILHYLPLQALSGQGLPMTVSYAPSASVLFHLLTTAPAAETERRTLAIGVNSGGLTNAEAEAQWVANHLQGQVLAGVTASVAAVTTALPHYDILHFACHSRFQRRRALDSGMVLADGELTASQILTACQLKAALVFLAACDTGLNELTHGDELFGLTRAFLGAGARSLLVTLWPIHEIPTRLFVEEFYRTWANGATRAAALHAAQSYLRAMNLHALRSKLVEYGTPATTSQELLTLFDTMLPGGQPFNHPYYWGPFVLVGNPY